MHQWIWNNVGSGGFISYTFLPIQNSSDLQNDKSLYTTCMQNKVGGFRLLGHIMVVVFHSQQ